MPYQSEDQAIDIKVSSSKSETYFPRTILDKFWIDNLCTESLFHVRLVFLPKTKFCTRTVRTYGNVR